MHSIEYNFVDDVRFESQIRSIKVGIMYTSIMKLLRQGAQTAQATENKNPKRIRRKDLGWRSLVLVLLVGVSCVTRSFRTSPPSPTCAV